MTRKFNITVSDWVGSEIVGNPKNKSARIEELIIKGFMAEKEKNIRASSENVQYLNGKQTNASYGILSHSNNYFSDHIANFSDFSNIDILSYPNL